MSRANFADPVTLVRSPTFTNKVSSLRYKGSSPLRLQSLDTGFLDLGGRSRIDSTMAPICSGVVPQHPPTIFTKPCFA